MNRLRRVFSLDLRSLAILRICFGLLMLIDILDRARDLNVFMTDQGVLPVAALWGMKNMSPKAISFICIHSWSGALWYQSLLVLLGLVFAIGLIIGFRTRLLTILCWWFVLSAQMRNPILFYGGDTILRMVLFWGIFLPWGSVWSFDSHGSEEIDSLSVCSFGTVGYTLQIAYQYFSSGMFKTSPEWLTDGTAVYYSLMAAQYEGVGGQNLAQIIEGFPWVGVALTYLCLAWERLFPLLLLSPFFSLYTRSFAVITVWVFHGALLCTLSLGLFPLIGLGCIVGLVPGEWWTKVARAQISARSNSPEVNFKGLQVIPLIATIWMWVYGLADLPQLSYRLPRPMVNVCSSLGWNQSWMLFAPGPPKDHGFYVAAGTTVDGDAVQLLGRTRPLSWERPALVPQAVGTMRWRMYCYRLFTRRSFRNYRELLCQYLAKRWESGGKPPLSKLELYYVWGTTQLHAPTAYQRSKLWVYEPNS